MRSSELLGESVEWTIPELPEMSHVIGLNQQSQNLKLPFVTSHISPFNNLKEKEWGVFTTPSSTKL